MVKPWHRLRVLRLCFKLHLFKMEGVKFTPFWCALPCCFQRSSVSLFCLSLLSHQWANRCPAHRGRLWVCSTQFVSGHCHCSVSVRGRCLCLFNGASCWGRQVSVMFANVWMLHLDCFCCHLVNVCRQQTNMFWPSMKTSHYCYGYLNLCQISQWMIPTVNSAGFIYFCII